MGMWGRFSGVLGLVALGFGLLSLLIFRGLTDFYTLAHIVIGVVLIAYWFFISGARKAGQATQIVSGRTVRYGANAVIYTVLFIGVLAAINWIGNRHNKRLDLTEQGVYSLAEQSAQLVKGLQKPLRIAAFDVGGEAQGGLKDLLALYKDSNPGKVTTEFINPRSKPQLVEKYGMKGGNIIYLEYGDSEPTAISRLNETTEEAITNGIMKLTQGDAKKIYYLTGHGEAKLEDNRPEGLKAFADAALDEHLTVEELTLATKGSIPADAAAVILMSPKSPLLPGERDLLIQYVDGGGRLLMMADPKHGEDVPAIAAHFGIQVGNDVVIDLVQRLLMGPTLATQFLAGSYAQHPITHGLGRQDAMVFDMANSVKATAAPADGVTYTDLVQTSDQGWAETNVKGIFDSAEATAQLDPEDIKGPVSVAVAYERKVPAGSKNGQSTPERTSRLIVFGDSDWMTNQFLRYASHRDVLLNSLNWLAGQESNISIRPRAMRTSLKPLQADTFRSLLMTGFIIPEFILLLGLFIWWRRRSVAV